ncbi:hypothetical protein PAI11_43400 [Patulibacter medicamentivorans]|uniref:Uncharacterized protein n=1 Tax=Patulibacter medicamentivorans TaxID=1097667 RepID=H0EBV7_9ACTN|nr:hypothetical protein PAI11_43400 [Patulibacter medicamentivorans]
MRAQGRDPAVGLRRRDHRRPHERHVDAREADPVAADLGRDAAGELVQRRLRRQVGGELGGVDEQALGEDVDDVALAALAHRRQQRQGQLDRGVVVDLHRPLEVVDPVVGAVHGPADRVAGVVDEDVDLAVLGQDRGRERIDRVEVRQVAGMDGRAATGGDDLVAHPLELRPAAGDQHDRRPGAGEPHRGRLADSRRCARDQDDPLANGVLERPGGQAASQAGRRGRRPRGRRHHPMAEVVEGPPGAGAEAAGDGPEQVRGTRGARHAPYDSYCE